MEMKKEKSKHQQTDSFAHQVLFICFSVLRGILCNSRVTRHNKCLGKKTCFTYIVLIFVMKRSCKQDRFLKKEEIAF